MDEIAIGAIRTAHGVKGFMKVRSFSGEWDHFTRLENIQLRSGSKRRDFMVEGYRWLGKELIIKIQGIDTPEEVKNFANWEIWVDTNYAAPLGKDEFYLRDLVGCDLVYSGEKIGQIKTFIEGGASDLVEVILETGEKRLIPFHEPFIGEIDTRKRVVNLLVDWILE